MGTFGISADVTCDKVNDRNVARMKPIKFYLLWGGNFELTVSDQVVDPSF